MSFEELIILEYFRLIILFFAYLFLVRVHRANFFRYKYRRLSSISILINNYLHNRNDLYIDEIQFIRRDVLINAC